MGIPKPLVQINQLFIVISVLVSLFIASEIIILPFTLGVITLITKQNPIINFSRRFLKKPKEQYIQEDKEQQIFNQWIATVSLGISLLAFSLGFSVIGYIFSTMVVIAASLALSGYCIGCTIHFRYLMWKHHRQMN